MSINTSADIIGAVKEKRPQFDLEEIIAKYRPIVSFRVKKSLGSHTPDWEDVVNEIMVNVLEKLNKGEFRGDSSIGTFIFTITSRRIIDYIVDDHTVIGIQVPGFHCLIIHVVDVDTQPAFLRAFFLLGEGGAP